MLKRRERDKNAAYVALAYMEKKRAIYRSRVNVLLKTLGLIFLILGLLTAYLTATTPLYPPVAATFYLIAALLAASGLVALIARIE
jgi:hypothetical protein